jgi:hypothetical protein
MNENQSGAGRCTRPQIEMIREHDALGRLIVRYSPLLTLSDTSPIWRPPVAGGDVEGKGTVAAAACVTDRGVIAQCLIWIGNEQSGIDFFLRVDPPVAEPVGMRQIVWRSLIPETHEPRRAVGIEKTGVGKVQTKIQGCDDATTPCEGLK